MNKYAKVLFLAVMFSFLWGVWWGLKRFPVSIPFYRNPSELHVLALKGALAPATIEKFKTKLKMTVNLHEVADHFEMLREILSHDQKYDVFIFSSVLLDSIKLDHYFKSLGEDSIENLQRVSVDFRNLDFDPTNEYVVPLFWGVNGWLVPQDSKEADFSLDQLIKQSKPVLVAKPDAAELYSLFKNLRPAVQTWVQTGNDEELRKELSSLEKFIRLETEKKPSDRVLTQVSNGDLSDEALQSARFQLPQEKAQLWLILGGVAKASKHLASGQEFLNFLLNPEWSMQNAQDSRLATVVEDLDDHKALPAYRKASYIRRLPIGRLQLSPHHEAFEPVFTSYLREAFPSFFSVNAQR